MPVATDSTAANPRENSKLYDFRLVDSSVHGLKFGATASIQLPFSHSDHCKHEKNKPRENFLVVSPYTDRAHLLDLDSVSQPNQLLAKAMAVMKPIRDDYATGPYQDIFNWAEIIATVRSLAEIEGYRWEASPFYVVVFRSQVPPTTDRSHLALLDTKSHEEAISSGGLLKYWFGVADAGGRNLATCIRRARDDAKRGSTGEGHRRAMMATKGMYSEWHLERLRLIVGHDALSWHIIEWTD